MCFSSHFYLFRNKSSFPSAPLPDTPELRLLLNPTYEGLILAGVPIGTDDFIQQTLEQNLATVQHRANGVMALGHTEPQCATRLLSRSITHSLDYLASLLPPRSFLPIATLFDRLLHTTLDSILSPTTHPVCIYGCY